MYLPDCATLDKLTQKAQKIRIKLPWEVMTMFQDVLPQDEEEDEDDIEAHEASIQRLKVQLTNIMQDVTDTDQVPIRKRTTPPGK